MSKKNELNIIRIYDAPLKLVWEAWTDPEQAAHWWGPRDFTITTHSKDLKVGGTWNYTMHGPDGIDYPNITKYFEVEKYSKLVYDHGATANTLPLFRVTVLFTETKGQTKMDMTMTLASAEAAEQIKKHIKKAGGNTTWDRLAEYLSKQTDGQERFVINRTFDAPIQTVFNAWTDPKHVAQWLSPTGTTMKFFKADIKVGGSTFYMMSGEGGFHLYGKTKYLEIESPHRLVYTQQFCDENEKISRHPMAPTWPETMMTVVNFAEEGPNQTRITITWEPTGEVSAAELAAFVKEKGGMTMGWTGSFDKLENYLGEGDSF
jgi:uncharacterized protein YndB with AHSA1/START domain